MIPDRSTTAPLTTRLPLTAVVLLISACAVGPDYEKPDISDITPAQWKWQEAKPRDAEPRGDWWTVFKDSELNRLQTLALQNNQQLRAAVARVDQARAYSKANSVAYVPQLTINNVARREQTSGNLPTPVPVDIPQARYNTFSVPLELAYEIDFWGRIRRSIESARAQTDAAVADYHNVMLTLSGDLAANYFLLRGYDAELGVMNRILQTREKTLHLLDQRFTAGAIPEADLARARSEVAATKADIAEVNRQREEAVNVIALLCGQSASSFRVRERGTGGSVPNIPAGLPASLLERRPDIAAAERQVAARNADIGVETAGYFPTVSLTGQGGYLSKETSSLFSADSKVWAIGPSVSVPVTSLFITKARVARARALREEAIANYRQAVLAAIQDVETSLLQIRQRREQAAALDESVTASRKAADLTRQRYESGATHYLELLDAERSLLTVERQASQIQAQRRIAAVRLIKALGGAW